MTGPDRVPVMHRTMPGTFRKYGPQLAELYARFPGDVLMSPKSHPFNRFKRAVTDHSGVLDGAKDEWGCVWTSLT